MGLVQMLMNQIQHGASPEAQAAAGASGGSLNPNGQGMGYTLPSGAQVNHPATQAPTPTVGPASTTAMPGQAVPGTPAPTNQMSAGQQALKSAGNALQAWGTHSPTQGGNIYGSGMAGGAAGPTTQYANPQLMQYGGLASLLGMR